MTLTPEQIARIEDTKDDWMYGIWFVGDGQTTDWMGALKKHAGKWVFEYRFRYYSEESKDPGDGKDRKSWVTATMPDDSPEGLAKCLEAIHQLLPVLRKQMNAVLVDFVDLQCRADDPKFFFELGSRDWAHLRRETMP